MIRTSSGLTSSTWIDQIVLGWEHRWPTSHMLTKLTSDAQVVKVWNTKLRASCIWCASQATAVQQQFSWQSHQRTALVIGAWVYSWRWTVEGLEYLFFLWTHWGLAILVPLIGQWRYMFLPRQFYDKFVPQLRIDGQIVLLHVLQKSVWDSSQVIDKTAAQHGRIVAQLARNHPVHHQEGRRECQTGCHER